MRLKEIMSTNVESVRPDDTIARARSQMRLKGIHHLVVRDHRRVTGILTDATLETRDAEGVERVEDAMFRNVVTGTPDMTVRRAANMLRGRADGALPVISAGKLVGIITVSDLLDVLGRGVDRPAAKDRWILRHRGIRPKRR